MTRYKNLSRKELLKINQLVEQRRNSKYGDLDKHYDHIARYCVKHGLRSLSFKRGRKGYPNAVSGSCELFNPLDFVTPAQRKVIEKQLEDLKK